MTEQTPPSAPQRRVDPSAPKRRVAIACQGGGSHTAFTAGALARFLEEDVLADHEIVGLSGTSGGAICAMLAWSGLLHGDPRLGIERLQGFWRANSAQTMTARWLNSLVLWGGLAAEMVALPAFSPYTSGAAGWSSNELRRIIDQTVDVAAEQRHALTQDAAPLLLLGAVDVVAGAFKAFDSTKGEISTEALLASAAIPNIFRSVRVGSGLYWDGLFSQNPPVTALRQCDPDEIWIIQVNPTAIDSEPRTVTDITVRRNELAGNLSLNQELAFLETVERWLENGTLDAGTSRRLTVRIMERRRTDASRQWGYVSKLNRDPEFIAELVALGREQATDQIESMVFERAWDSGDVESLMALIGPDALVSSDHPRALLAPTRDRDTIRAYLGDLGLNIEASRARLTHNMVGWDLRRTGDADFAARALAAFDDAGRARRLIITTP